MHASNTSFQCRQGICYRCLNDALQCRMIMVNKGQDGDGGMGRGGEKMVIYHVSVPNACKPALKWHWFGLTRGKMWQLNAIFSHIYPTNSSFVCVYKSDFVSELFFMLELPVNEITWQIHLSIKMSKVISRWALSVTWACFLQMISAGWDSMCFSYAKVVWSRLLNWNGEFPHMQGADFL